ncbi:universal stress protein [Planobispora rosea]|uniref:universal stress protein n=1 Tax=Planobispora rosea TaxID=35762 RepID=UPI001E348AA4|nr:universal stress protein [Planobispora rosea]
MIVVHAASRPVYREIVVGIDDSPQCDPALAYAFEQAAQRGARLRAVHAWQLPVHACAPEIVSDSGVSLTQAAAERGGRGTLNERILLRSRRRWSQVWFLTVFRPGAAARGSAGI